MGKQSRKQIFTKLLNLAKRCSKRGRAHLVRRSPDWVIRALLRASAHYMRNVHPAKKKTVLERKLTPYRGDMAYLARCKNLKKARERLVQRGGILPFIFPIAKLALKSLAVGAGRRIIDKLTNKKEA